MLACLSSFGEEEKRYRRDMKRESDDENKDVNTHLSIKIVTIVMSIKHGKKEEGCRVLHQTIFFFFDDAAKVRENVSRKNKTCPTCDPKIRRTISHTLAHKMTRLRDKNNLKTGGGG